MTLETLIPYAETSHVRDSAVWKVPEGIAVRWVNMGEGNVDIDGWIKKFIAGQARHADHLREPGVRQPARPQNLRREVLGQLAKMPASELSRFLGDRREGDAEAGGTATARARRPGSSGSTISKPACATRAICCSDSETRGRRPRR